MKKTAKARVLIIPSKLTVDISVTFDSERSQRFGTGEIVSDYNGDIYTTLNLAPLIILAITRTGEMDENGVRQRPAYNQGDRLAMTRYQLPIFINALDRTYESLKIPEMFSYVSKRLTVNEELAEKARRVFAIGTYTTVELVPVVILQPDETRIEGIKVKFNNEDSTVLLTLNDVESLLFNLKTMNVDSTVMMLYRNYLSGSTATAATQRLPQQPRTVDIKPKADEFYLPEEEVV